MTSTEQPIIEPQPSSTPSSNTPPRPTASRPPLRPARAGRRTRRSLLVVGLLCLALGGAIAWQVSEGRQQKTPQSQAPLADGNAIISQDEEIVSAVADKVGPSVVSIVTESIIGSTRRYSAAVQQGAGTGIIVSKDGYIMTNNHVIEGARNVTVIASDGKRHENVTVIGRDPLNDVAFLKIKGVNDLRPAELGDSRTVRTGQRVVAIGNALGQFQNTVTSGIISGTGRPITASDESGQASETLTDLLQTDAAINSGNSGGPLVNSSGQVIGINTAVSSVGTGLGFAIPINATKGVLAGVLENGEIRRAFLGVSYREITPDVAAEEKLPVTQGAYVATEGVPVQSNGPADRAGIKPGDIITKLDGNTLGKQGNLSSLAGQYRPGQTVDVEVLRGDKTKVLKLTFGAFGA